MNNNTNTNSIRPFLNYLLLLLFIPLIIEVWGKGDFLVSSQLDHEATRP
jgi:hypothetical protein